MWLKGAYNGKMVLTRKKGRQALSRESMRYLDVHSNHKLIKTKTLRAQNRLIFSRFKSLSNGSTTQEKLNS